MEISHVDKLSPPSGLIQKKCGLTTSYPESFVYDSVASLWQMLFQSVLLLNFLESLVVGKF